MNITLSMCQLVLIYDYHISKKSSRDKKLEKELEDRGYTVVTPMKLGLPEKSWQFYDAGPHCTANQIAKLDRAAPNDARFITFDTGRTMDRQPSAARG